MPEALIKNLSWVYTNCKITPPALKNMSAKIGQLADEQKTNDALKNIGDTIRAEVESGGRI